MNYVHGRAVTSLSHSAPRRKHTHTLPQILEKHLSETDFLCLQVSVCGLWPQGVIFGEIRLHSHAFVSLTCRRRPSGWFHAHPRATPLQMSRLHDPWILWCLYICVCVFVRERMTWNKKKNKPSNMFCGTRDTRHQPKRTLQIRWFNISRTCFKLKCRPSQGFSVV